MKSSSAQMSEKRGVITDFYWTSLFAQAAKEGLVKADEKTIEDLVIYGKNNRVESVLPLLVIFEELIIPHQGQPESPTIPILEQTDFYHPVSDTLKNTLTIGRNWGKRDNESWAKGLESPVSLIPFIIDRLLRNQTLEVGVPEGLSRREYYEAIIEFAKVVYSADQSRIKDTRLCKMISAEKVDSYKRVLLSKGSNPANMSKLELLVFTVISCIDQIELAQRLSTKYGAIATVEAYSSEKSIDASNFIDTYVLVETAVRDETGFFPAVRSIKDALKLRTDPTVRSFRKQLMSYQKCIYDGNSVDALLIKADLNRASALMREKYSCEIALDLFTYTALPLALAETLLQVPNIASGIIGGLSVAGSIAGKRTMKENEWVLLGRKLP